MKIMNLLVRFLLELSALAAFAFWGARTGGTMAARVGLALVTPLAFAALWVFFASPASSLRLEDPLRLLFELTVFGLAVAAVAMAGKPVLATVYATAAVLNIVLMTALGQRRRAVH